MQPRGSILAWATAAGSLLVGAPVNAQTNEPPRPLALVGGTIHIAPGEAPISDGVVVVDGGVVASVGARDSVEIPDGAERLDCAGLSVLAGFWNSHVHFFERKWEDAAATPADELSAQLRSSLVRFGFTSVFDTGSALANTTRLRERVESGEVAGPRIRTTGEALVAPGAMPSDRVLAVLGFSVSPTPEIEDARQAAEAARALLDAGADGVKVHLQPPPPPGAPIPREALDAALRAAREAGRPGFVHPHTTADVRAAVLAGVDVVAHTTPMSDPWDEDLLEAMRASGVALTPTLLLWKSALRHDRSSVQSRVVASAVAQLRSFHAGGGAVLFGTDLGATDPDPVGEYRLMRDAGMDFDAILASLTTGPAAHFGDSAKLGRVAPGMLADLVVLDGDPAKDLEALVAVRYTLRDGVVIYRSSD